MLQSSHRGYVALIEPLQSLLSHLLTFQHEELFQAIVLMLKVSSSMRFLLFGRGSFSVELGVAPESCLGDGVASTDVAAVVMEITWAPRVI